MDRHIVLLRGVNVGRGRRVPMAAFKSLLEGLGHTVVSTLLNSGNAVFSSRGQGAALADGIARALQTQLQVSTRVIVKSADEWAQIIAANPFAPVDEAEHPRLLVALGQRREDLAALAPLKDRAAAGDRFALTGPAAYLHCAAGLLDSPLASALLGKPGQAVTTRNWATVLKLAALAGVAA